MLPRRLSLEDCYETASPGITGGGQEPARVLSRAIDIADGDLGATIFLQLIQHWPSAAARAAARPSELEESARSARRGWPGRFARKVTGAMTVSRLQVRPQLARAKAGAIALAAA
jgi:hypothetical protein